MKKQNKIIFLIGPSGSGKTTVENDFLSNDSKKYGDFFHIVSHATRKKRENEIDGIDYYFISDAEFDNMKNTNDFIQMVSHAGARKGSSKKEWKNKIKQGHVIMPVLLSSAIDLIKNLTFLNSNIKDYIHIIYFNISKKEALDRLINRYAIETNYSNLELLDLYNSKNNNNNLSSEIIDIFKEIDLRLHDIDILKPTENYTKYIINIENNTKEDVYNKFIEYIDDIFSK